MKLELRRLTGPAAEEFENVGKLDWSRGVAMAELLQRVNRVAEKLSADVATGDMRVSPVFTPRSLRHYQTQGCINAPERMGRCAAYGFHHFLQALLVRSLLWERMRLEHIVELMAGLGSADIKALLLGGMEIGSCGTTKGNNALGSTVEDTTEIWKRLLVTPGIELHIRQDSRKFCAAEVERIVSLLESVIRSNL